MSIARYFYYEVLWLPTLIIQLLYKHISRFLHWISVILHKQCKLTLTIILVHKMIIIISMNWEVFVCDWLRIRLLFQCSILKFINILCERVHINFVFFRLHPICCTLSCTVAIWDLVHWVVHLRFGIVKPFQHIWFLQNIALRIDIRTICRTLLINEHK